MSTTTIDMSQVESMHRAEVGATQVAIDKASRTAAARLKEHLMRRADDLGISDTGAYRESFVVDGASVTNEAPYAGVIELGARPHAVSSAGIEALADWVQRKLNISDEHEAVGIAYAIADKIKREGVQPKYVMRDSLEKAREFFDEELTRAMLAQGYS